MHMPFRCVWKKIHHLQQHSSNTIRIISEEFVLKRIHVIIKLKHDWTVRSVIYLNFGIEYPRLVTLLLSVPRWPFSCSVFLKFWPPRSNMFKCGSRLCFENVFLPGYIHLYVLYLTSIMYGSGACRGSSVFVFFPLMNTFCSPSMALDGYLWVLNAAFPK